MELFVIIMFYQAGTILLALGLMEKSLDSNNWFILFDISEERLIFYSNQQSNHIN